jgi:tRNA G10  N-methylase Trm11
VTAHPAVYSDELMPIFQQIVDIFRQSEEAEYPMVLDPFAGTGKIHELVHCTTWGVEIEPEWAEMHSMTILGDATNLASYWRDLFDIVITSPTYANRMADHHDAKDGSKRITYRHKLGRPLNPRNTGGMQWGEEYMQMHRLAWNEAWRVLRPGGWFVLNVRDHIRKGERVPVCDWHVLTLKSIGFELRNSQEVKTKGMRFGANRDLRLDHEMVYTFVKPSQPEQKGTQ